MSNHKVHYCENCNVSSKEKDVLAHAYSDIWMCEDCIEEDDDLAGSKFEHPSEFEESYRIERKNIKKNRIKELEKQHAESLKRFVASDEIELVFNKNTSKKLRAYIHRMAKSLNLEHESTGEGSNRVLTVRKKVVPPKPAQ